MVASCCSRHLARLPADRTIPSATCEEPAAGRLKPPSVPRGSPRGLHPAWRIHRQLLSRASLSIVLNIAEGAGKISAADKRRYYLSARGSATESAALLDVLALVKLATESDHRTGNELLIRIVSMLASWLEALRNADIGHGHGHGTDGHGYGHGRARARAR